MYTSTHDILDLHGTSYQEVFNKVDRFIGENLLKGTSSVSIITGHSKEMIKQVKRVLDDYEMYSQESVLTPDKLTIDLT